MYDQMQVAEARLQHQYENEALGQGSGDQFAVGHFGPLWFSFSKSHRSSGNCRKLVAKTKPLMTRHV